ncbi:MAG: polyphosphate kinase 1, partial [Cyanobacteria bacterium J06641_5]
MDISASTTAIDLQDTQYYFNRELSWLEFNRRVLHEALDPRTPLLERLKFLAIFSSNLDEFFMVRVAGLKKQVEAGVTKLTPDGRTPERQLEDIVGILRPIVVQQHEIFEKTLRATLTTEKVFLVDYVDLDEAQRLYYQEFFKTNVFPVLTPLAVDPSHPFPYISNLSFNLAVGLRYPDSERELFARIKLPPILPRFVPLPDTLRNRQEAHQGALWVGTPLEQIVSHNLDALFPGTIVRECYPFRVTRNADIDVEEDEADDLLLAIEKELRKRRIGGSAVRMEVHATMPMSIRNVLMDQMSLSDRDVYDVDGTLGLGDLFAFLGLPLPQHKDIPWSPTVPDRFHAIERRAIANETTRAETLFATIREGDLLLHHPYHSFNGTVQAFIALAAGDPKVLAIKMTLYRTSGDSPIIKSLIAAAANGKQVVVLVELKARFDEENNILWARKLERSGVHVVYGLVGLKTHTKIALAVRQEGDRIRRYCHIGTGNYNSKTAKLYTDLGLITCREDIGSDLTDLFNFLTGYSRQTAYRKLLVAPVSLRSRMLELIARECERCRAGGNGRIVVKVNSLVDPAIIAALYKASQAGVEIDAIVRGICCLRPGVPGISENIRVISIIGRFLEHS